MADKKEIEVNVVSFEGLFDGKKKVVIPEYQRPYEWGKTKTADLLADLQEYFLGENQPLSPYYMGSVLFYFDSKNKSYEIIDGQQRITTLLILKNVLNKSLPANQDIHYDSHLSFNAIKETTNYAKSEENLLKKLSEFDFLNQLEFTQVVTYSQDDSFAFFDTQNNRGVSLGSTDFLKAYHLREIESAELQEANAISWESSALKWENDDFLSFLFDKVLFRARAWKSKNTPYEAKNAVLDLFQKRTVKSRDSMTYPLFSNNQNRQATFRTYRVDGKFTDILNTSNVKTPALFPFNLRQPIYKGLNFFHFTEKYTAIHQLVFDHVATESKEVIAVRQFFNDVYNDDMSVYLRYLFKLCVIMYYDIFEDREILRFTFYLDYLIGSVRIGKSMVKKESAQKCLTEPDHNLLDIISYADEPSEVFQFIIEIPRVDTIYKDIVKNEHKIPKVGVQPRYRDRVIKYFTKEKKEFKNRKHWLNE